MENASYTILTRHTGLMNEMNIIANNIANSNTTGFRQEGLIFSEFVRKIEGGPSLSMATGRTESTSFQAATLSQTEGPFDLAIEGDGFFLIGTPDGQRLTRAGHFMPNAQGDLVTPDGHTVLDAGGAALFVPPNAATVKIAADGTLSADGQILGQVGVVVPAEGAQMIREPGVMFRAEGGTEPALEASVLQGFLEGSNVNPLTQIARMIEVQRAYEMGQSFAETENTRMQSVLRTLIK
jgi:flagellar basal-body rod protein FlgF